MFSQNRCDRKIFFSYDNAGHRKEQERYMKKRNLELTGEDAVNEEKI